MNTVPVQSEKMLSTAYQLSKKAKNDIICEICASFLKTLDTSTDEKDSDYFIKKEKVHDVARKEKILSSGFKDQVLEFL